MIYSNKQFVRWDDIDAFGHVNNAKYLTYIQEARFQWSFYEVQSSGEQPTLLEMVVARNEIDYLVPIYNGGLFYTVNLWVNQWVTVHSCLATRLLAKMAPCMQK